MKRWIILCVVVVSLMAGSVVLVDQGMTPATESTAQTKSEIKNPAYELELGRWNVSNDGTNPQETTKGINSALQWAKENAYKSFIIPDGTYLIAKGTEQSDSEDSIYMVSDMDLMLSEKTILQKEANAFEGYSVLSLDKSVKNVTVKGGTFLGDRDHHDYSKKGTETAGTHEWGYGISIIGAENVVIDGVKTEKFTGDGIFVGGSTITGSSIMETDLELGSIDDMGRPVKAKGKIRTNNRDITNFDDPAYKIYENIHFWLPNGIADGSKVDVYYYRKDGSFIKADKQIAYFSGESLIPKEADYFRAVFEAASTKGVQVERMTVAIAKNITIKNSDIGYNRRQGISLVGSDGVQIVDNHIHHTNGTAPQSGIDVEPGFYPGKNTIIKGNRFTDNIIQVVLAYGENVRIEDNHFEQNVKNSVGVYVHEGFSGEIDVKDNSFNGSGLTLDSENAMAESNQFKNGEVNLVGKNITFRKSTLVDTSLDVGSGEGQKISNVTIQHNGIRPLALYIRDKSVLLKNVAIKAKTKGKDLILGPGNSQNVYDRLKVEDSDESGTVLPAGTYIQCSFKAGSLAINNVGKYVLDECVVKSKGNLLMVDSTYGKPDVAIKNSDLEVMGNIEAGAAVYILGAQNFELLDSMVLAKNNSNSAPLIKIGPYGDPIQTNVFDAIIKGNILHTNTDISAIDTSNAGTNAPSYSVEDNTIYNASLDLTKKDRNHNNKLITH
ncbi:right-handed parallel beta-helix repeat-containing protein [Lederbergia citrea]|uniref:Right-handed parallel beta-helix repeat-containing protein n=1 Tax=Lederbergia citrea TaxID=2833581 RepID=A0A942Z6R7_9BACI|nr:right-handed parallel beta-helix repeat-containing protein [Lederbergia citrea]MBS4205791.1 right-handed parallel beta-helix repeat-containing protein [Lederbergia citrea]MBS4224760.1 right-handed parallel beta-helix repeat-containing protein [Lederbergia citrea]